MITLSNKMFASVNFFETDSDEEFAVTLADVKLHQEFESGGPTRMTITGIVNRISEKGEKHEHVPRLQTDRR